MTGLPLKGVLFHYPPRAALNRNVPKARILAGAKVRRGLRDRLTAELAQIVWASKLATVSLNLPASAEVAEIQVFRLTLKPDVADVGEPVLRALDQAIPSPILFEVQGDPGIKTVAAYKRPSEADAGKWVLGDYLRGDWLPIDASRQPLPVALDMAGLYRELMRALIPLPPRAGESLREQLERLSAARAAERECARLENQLNGETQFNRKVEINRLLREARHTLQSTRAAYAG
ncbi:MAG: DUF4391 domain-containing protein [Chloroflexota bacterium]|nr:DUF4391 domain-containing protein [Chloroflexota bacterium]